MSAEIIRLRDRRRPVLRAIDDLSTRETEATAWLRRAGPIAKQLNEEAAGDPPDAA